MAIRFDNADTDYLTSVANYTPPTTGSVSFWVNLNTIAGTRYFYGVDTDFRMRMPASGLIRARMFRSNPNALDAVTPLVINTWYHILLTWSVGGGNSTLALYINGALDAGNTTADTTPSPGPIRIGTANYIGDSMDGRLADFRLYSRVLALDEAQTLHACRGADNMRQGLSHRWIMNEKEETVVAAGALSVIDTVSELNLTPTNSPVYEGSILKSRRAA